MQALGLIEVVGFITAVEATDAALKSADVKLLGITKVGSGILTVQLVGDVGAINAAVYSGAEAAERVGTLRTKHVIARTSENILSVFEEKTVEKVLEEEIENMIEETENALVEEIENVLVDKIEDVLVEEIEDIIVEEIKDVLVEETKDVLVEEFENTLAAEIENVVAEEINDVLVNEIGSEISDEIASTFDVDIESDVKEFKDVLGAIENTLEGVIKEMSLEEKFPTDKSEIVLEITTIINDNTLSHPEIKNQLRKLGIRKIKSYIKTNKIPISANKLKSANKEELIELIVNYSLLR